MFSRSSGELSAAAPPVRGRWRRKLGDNLTAYGLLAAALVVFALFSWWPLIRGVLLSFQQVDFVNPPSWVGFENFERLFNDPLFGAAWRNTLLFTGLALLLGFAVPFLTAVVLNELRHARSFFRVAVYLPVMLPPVVTALLWKWFYNPGPGLFNEGLRAVGLPGLSWLDSGSTAMISLVLVSTWANMGSTTLIYLAALQTIPGELYEAAELDGANLWRRLVHVTIPQTRFVLLVLLLLQVVATMQVFTEPYVMTGGGPEDATVTLLLLLYRYAFYYNDFGTASALSLLLFVVLGIFSATYVRLTRTRS
ncbi:MULTISPECIES: carbohydrate ABC transporter permease [unclassified Crossiella]|uniref:carbohydrate ABC transporter permease n=1 Tax=unclassified Crossiella TaxID=2620835 RepID=UPI001FFE7E42|nr:MULTISPECIES: sugar ABC transporter permease [unclassified Crossiella]MCK2239601.1 sugar ABC transporter permease [Crossiella sp. S99.2]MCK2252296.1 sugar ABC transporter permease [Crossiella sp. S99.1]